jgi:hypothetical protein
MAMFLSQASTLNTVKNKVVAIKSDTATLKTKTSDVLSEVQSLSDLAAIAGPLADVKIIGTIVDSVQPVVEMLQVRKDEFDDFNANAFRSELSDAVQTLADMQMAISGNVGPGIIKLQAKLATANDFVLFSLSETPLVELIDLTQGLSSELATLLFITEGAIADIESSYTTEQIIRITSLGMSAAAPAYVSCSYVLDNVNEGDITNLNLIRLRMKQISGVGRIAIEIMPKHLTIGVTAVGGGTISIPNPVLPMVAAIKKIGDKYYGTSENWTNKYDSCSEDELSNRLDAFLTAQGY